MSKSMRPVAVSTLVAAQRPIRSVSFSTTVSPMRMRCNCMSRSA